MNMVETKDQDGSHRFAVELDASDFKRLNVPELVKNPEQARIFFSNLFDLAEAELKRQFPGLANQALNRELGQYVCSESILASLEHICPSLYNRLNT